MQSARDMDFSELEFREITKFYKSLRGLLYTDLAANFPGLQFGSISEQDAVTADKWDSIDPNKGRDLINWRSAYKYYSAKSRFKRFDLRIKDGSNLIGLSYGMPSQVKTQLKIDLIEGTPISLHKGKTKALEVVTYAAQMYGILLGANEIRIMRPINKAVIDLYDQYGFSYVESQSKRMPSYCSMKLEV
ncbi:hypothetical protein QWY82_00970 [Simiduia curdlanivorans]|uniref:N-acetyltransferase n=1 Tax=Simiduia curdlanivorans TaxID=1492769 RepID=A0ABV8V6E3_9GAMM|nr:hypothetical protein [Simiduia curdlanivorans]MDN3637366.1 hypothetical protein [Simiduia curdlanivorans]